MPRFLNSKISEKGFAALFFSILMMAVIFALGSSIIILTLDRQKVSRNIVKSVQAYYAAEAGIEDSLLRIFDPGMNFSLSNTINAGDGTANIQISGFITPLTITSIGSASDRIRKIETEAAISTTGANFFYGIQVGVGGLSADSGSQILGNVFSNGPVSGAANVKIYGDIFSAGAAGVIDNFRVLKSEPTANDGNAYAHTISNSSIENGAYFQIEDNITAGIKYPGSPDTGIQNMPISGDQITSWKTDAVSEGTIPGYSLVSGADSLGPVKVDGDFEIMSNAVLTITGTIWVTGNITINSGSVLELDSGFGINSGIIIADGLVSTESNVIICGAEGYGGSNCNPSIGSFLMILSTNSSLDPDFPAIESDSNSDAAIIYADNGLIKLNSNAQLKEVTGYALHLDSNAVVTYETGLADVRFTSGPSGGWEIISWEEKE